MEFSFVFGQRRLHQTIRYPEFKRTIDGGEVSAFHVRTLVPGNLLNAITDLRMLLPSCREQLIQLFVQKASQLNPSSAELFSGSNPNQSGEHDPNAVCLLNVQWNFLAAKRP